MSVLKPSRKFKTIITNNVEGKKGETKLQHIVTLTQKGEKHILHFQHRQLIDWFILIDPSFGHIHSYSNVDKYNGAIQSLMELLMKGLRIIKQKSFIMGYMG